MSAHFPTSRVTVMHFVQELRGQGAALMDIIKKTRQLPYSFTMTTACCLMIYIQTLGQTSGKFKLRRSTD